MTLSLSSFLASESSISLTEEASRAAVELCCSSKEEEEEKGEEEEEVRREGPEEDGTVPAEPFREEGPDDGTDAGAEVEAEVAEVAVEEEGLPEPSPRSAVPPLASRMSEA